MKHIVHAAIALVVAGFVFSGCATYEDQKNLQKKVDALEKKVDVLETKLTELEAAKRVTEAADFQRDSALRICLAQAEAVYWDFIERNSTKTGTGYASPTYVVEAALRQKQNKIDECKLLYR